jgi:hypothetical protein
MKIKRNFEVGFLYCGIVKSDFVQPYISNKSYPEINIY